MGNRDKKVVFILVALIFAVFSLLVYFICKPQGEEEKQDSPTPTEIQEVTPSLPAVPDVTKQPTSSPTPTPLLALNITPMIPERKPTTGVGESGNAGVDGSTGEEIVVQDPLGNFMWSDSGLEDISDLYALANFVAEVYSEQTGTVFEGFPITEQEYSIFEKPYAYYIDKYGFLHVNVRVTADGQHDQYISGVVGYYGAELAVYDVEVIKE